MFKDRILIGTIAGMIATLFKDFPNYIFYKCKLVKYLYWHLAASAHLFPADIHSPYGMIIGVLSDIITGGSIGAVSILFFSRFGTDYWWYKGLIIGNAIWLFGLGVILNLGAVHSTSADPVFRLTALFDHQLFGLITAYIIYWWSQKYGL